MTDSRTDDPAAQLLTAAGFPHDSTSVQLRLERPEADIVACQLNRLRLYLDPRPLPPPSTAGGRVAFAYYERNWRPGAARTPQGRASALRRWMAQWPSVVALCT